ncbi:peroxisomal hydratase-dehydrogenase-epimerase [Multifurca ochricompacta]|uniref:Peroxisomal hydratase-dehydrogenase-epimerase n=1 Tax=Multifurca ochricompacta TaxID=376703 RepID=A0AAD4M8R5_9AGAM|nr:peroxisomal hydratase-dehydrogenase-epimerase [Multifurca ochricompacta]
MALSFKGHTVVVTGAGGGLAERQYSLLYGSRGANVVVNDFNKEAAQKVVDEINAGGAGRAVVNGSSATDGHAVIKTALDTFGGVTILINNAGVLRDKGFRNMSDREWDQIQDVHLKGAFSCTHAAWPIFRKQKFGRIVNTSSAAGLFGNFGQANYSAAKMGLVGFTKTIAREGAKYNIKANAIAPIAASAMTATVMPPEMLQNFGPEHVAPLVAAITHPNGPDTNGRVFVLGAGYVSEIRWERSRGVVFKTDESFTPSAVKQRWEELTDFTNPEHPQGMGDVNVAEKLEQSRSLPSNKQASPEVRFDGQTVIVTGAGGGLGRSYALMFGRLGANVVVNDVSEKGAQAVVDEIIRAGGSAVPAVCSAEDGENIVKVALEKFHAVHVLIANAGILRDKSFTAMSETEWDQVIAVHLRGTYKCAKAVWPIFHKQKYGRILTTASGVGIYGNFGQANYSTAKAAIIGFTRAIAIEGRKYNILANVLAPSAGTAMTQTIWPQEMVEAFKPDFIAPVVGYLVSKDNEETSGSLFEVSGGWAAQTRWQQAGGHGFPVNRAFTPEDVITKWQTITNFDDGRATNPSSTQEGMERLVENFGNQQHNEGGSGNKAEEERYFDSEDSDLVKEAKRLIPDVVEYTYDERDIIVYNMGIGATEKELQWVYEGDENFGALPTFGVCPQFASSAGFPFDWLPNFNPAKLLHGEQYLSIKGPIPTSGTLINQARLYEVLDKGKAGSVTAIVHTTDKRTGQVIFENQTTLISRGSGGFGGKRIGNDRGPASAANTPPNRKPDAVLEEKTSHSQAALYRLSGDPNPLHIHPDFATSGGFERPILHGLCSMGISGKHVVKTFGPFSDIKVRFAGIVYPGETLITEMWKEGDKVIFETKVKERRTTVLNAAAVTLASPGRQQIKAKL